MIGHESLEPVDDFFLISPSPTDSIHEAQISYRFRNTVWHWPFPARSHHWNDIATFSESSHDPAIKRIESESVFIFAGVLNEIFKATWCQDEKEVTCVSDVRFVAEGDFVRLRDQAPVCSDGERSQTKVGAEGLAQKLTLFPGADED